MPTPYFASPLGQSHKKSIGELQSKRSRKRKRGTHNPVETSNADGNLLGEAAHDDEDEAETATKATTIAFSPGTGLRQQHLNVLTSLLHRCILKKDYERASRAWGMLLRMEVNGHPLDIRAQDRWGIGAELLLHGGTSLTNHLDPEESETRDQSERQNHHSADSFQRGLMKAKDYYERLILQFPFRKSAANSISSLTFYPVMFGIWIHSIQLRHRLTMQKALQKRLISPNLDSENSVDSDDEYSHSSSTSRPTENLIARHQTIIQDANEIVERLEELLISPPCSDHSGLWKIKGMLHLWIGQLSDNATSFQQDRNTSDDDYTPAASTRQNLHPTGVLFGPQQDQTRSENRQGHRRDVDLKAREAFLKTLALGDTLDARTRQEVGL
ncbi:MAG: hypothetical protein L6R41_005452 [Letrouitia leprolyta]|nr:MAG: hypothetical protein L6R41_005452 [Letrouitia leprolyta]